MKQYHVRKIFHLAFFLNFILLGCVIAGFLLRKYAAYSIIGHFLSTLGLYGLSGSITNTLALWMIFEKVPGIWQSGMIEQNFKQFQIKLKETLLEHLFQKSDVHVNFDYHQLAQSLRPKLAASPMGMLVQLMSADQFLQLLKELELDSMLRDMLDQKYWDQYLTQQIAQLSPDDVKDLIWKILDENLQWLVIWGAFFGIIFGCIDLWLY